MERVYNYASKKIEEVDAVKAEELTSKGEAIKLNIPKLSEFETTANRLHNEYEAKVAKIKESDNPSMLVEGVKEYEIKKLHDEYEQATSQLADNYSQWRATQIEEAKKKAARSFVKVSDKDKQLAEQLAARYSLRIASDGQDAALAIAKEIALLSDSERVALQSHIGGLLASIDAEPDKKRIIDAVRTVKNEDAIAYDVARQLPVDILTKKRVADIARHTALNNKSIFGDSSGITHDEYLKMKGGK